MTYETLGTYSGRGVAMGTETASLLQENLPGQPHKVLEGLDNIVGAGRMGRAAGLLFRDGRQSR